MKKLLIVLLVVITVVAVSPKFIGTLVADERQSLISKINEAEGVEVSSKSYSAHWFGATSVLEVTLQLVDEGLGDIVITVDEVLSFGPIIITDNDWYLALGHSDISFRSPAGLVDDEIMNFVNEKMHISATFTFTDNIVTNISTDEVTFEDGDTQFVAQSSSGKFSLANKKDFSGELNWGGLELKSTDGSFVIGNVVMDTQQHLVSGNYLEGTAILSGDAKFLVDNINYSDITGSEIFALKKLLFTTSVAIKNDLLALSLAYGAEQVVTVGQTFKQPNLDIVIADVDVNALQELNTLLANLPTNVAEQGMSAEVSKAIAELADKFLAKDPSLKITDFSLIAEQGKIASDFNLTIDKTRFDSQNLLSVMSALNADAKGNAPVEFFTQFGLMPMIDNFVEQGYLTKKDSELSFVAKYSQAKLHVNGKAIQY
jgi:hypothetical protein